MANDLQSLYKMRDILKREEYVRTYNEGVKQNLKKSVCSTIATELGRKNKAYQDYQSIRSEKQKELVKKNHHVIPTVLLLIAFAVAIIITAIVSKDPMYGLMYFFVTCVWGMMISFVMVAGASDKQKPKNEYFIGFRKALFSIMFVACIVLSIVFASVSGACDNFWKWLLAVVLFVVWIVANFFFIGKASWVVLVLAICISVAIYKVWIGMIYAEDSGAKADCDDKVRIAKAHYERTCADYDAAYNAQYAKMKDAFLKTLKPDTSAQEKRAMLPVIPQQFQNFDMINKLIWCIEQRYAYDIVGARNWYLQQEHNAAMQQKMNNIANEVRRSNDIAAQAAADARAAHAEAMKAVNTLNKNVEKGNKLAEKGNQIARDNVAANQKAADYAEKTYDQLRSGTTSVHIK